MDRMLDENVTKQVREFFKPLINPVAILFFGTDAESCDYCEPTREMLKEIVELNPLLSLHSYDIVRDAGLAEKYHVDKTPGIVLTGVNGEKFVDYGIRISGIPAGHEFSTLIHDILLVSKRETNLSQATKEFLKSLQKPVHLQVFTTPT
jgi:alkyl hydroperoxide reductase subunit AhpF